MIKKIFYNSSLPRSGSTLIQNILGQNPTIHTTPTSGLYEVLCGIRTVYSTAQEFKAQNDKLMEAGIRGALKGAIYGFHNQLTDREYVIDKCRGWGSEINFISEYDENPKIICMIRDLRGVFASLEKKYRKNNLVDHHIANWQTLTGNTTEKRIAHWTVNPPTGQALDRLWQIFQQGLFPKILFVKFEDLCEEPDTQLRRIYEYLELPYYQHDYQNIIQLTHEDDKVYGVFGDHVIRQKLEPVKEDFFDVLGQQGCNMITNQYKWFYDTFRYKI